MTTKLNLDYKTIIGECEDNNINFVYCYQDYAETKQIASLLRTLKRYYSARQTRKYLLGWGNMVWVEKTKEEHMPITKEKIKPNTINPSALYELARNNNINRLYIHYENRWLAFEVGK